MSLPRPDGVLGSHRDVDRHPRRDTPGFFSDGEGCLALDDGEGLVGLVVNVKECAEVRAHAVFDQGEGAVGVLAAKLDRLCQSAELKGLASPHRDVFFPARCHRSVFASSR